MYKIIKTFNRTTTECIAFTSKRESAEDIKKTMESKGYKITIEKEKMEE